VLLFFFRFSEKKARQTIFKIQFNVDGFTVFNIAFKNYPDDAKLLPPESPL
jgi:hypothetical protein